MTLTEWRKKERVLLSGRSVSWRGGYDGKTLTEIRVYSGLRFSLWSGGQCVHYGTLDEIRDLCVD